MSLYIPSLASVSLEEGPVVLPCYCATYADGSVSHTLCPAHANTDPCLTLARVCGTRRKGTVRKGVCTHCGHNDNR